MLLKSLSLRGFRNYDVCHLHFEKGINCFYGDNAQGKTSLLEAISVLSTGKSFRTPNLKELINKNHEHFFLDAQFEKEGHLHRLKFFYDGKEKRIEYNFQNYPNFHPLLGTLPCVIISPEDIELIKGGPQSRRRFLDFLIAQIDPLYLFHLTRYHKAMKQRNALLKMKSFDAIYVWENLMVESASYLFEKRLLILSSVQKFASEWFQSLSHATDNLTLKYQALSQLKKSPENYSTILSNLFSEMREKEAIIGQTLSGPHRDDIEIFINDKIAESFASEGQKRMILIALKFAQWSVLNNELDAPPLLAFDDFGVHLDDKRKAWASDTAKKFQQVFLTCPNPLEKEKAVTHYFVHEGKVELALLRVE